MPSNKPVVVTVLTVLFAAGGCSIKNFATRDAEAGAPKVARPVGTPAIAGAITP